MRGAPLVAAGLLAAATAPGCGWWGSQSSTVKGGAYGTGAGAAAGAAIGAILGGGEGAWEGAAIGAAVGGLGGTALGYYMDDQAKEMQQVLDRQDRLERAGQTLQVSLSSDVLFDSGSATLQPGAADKLRQVAQVLGRYPRTQVEIVGNTDSRGSADSNQRLSEARADAVRDLLVQDGVDPARIRTHGVGATRPVATNDTATGRAMNRRVDLTVTPDASFAADEQRPGGGQAAPPPAPSYEPR